MFDDERIVALAIEDGAKDFNSFFFAAASGEPTWRFGKAPDEDDDGNGKDELEGDGGAPGDRATNVGEAEVDPVLRVELVQNCRTTRGGCISLLQERYQHQ